MENGYCDYDCMKNSGVKKWVRLRRIKDLKDDRDERYPNINEATDLVWGDSFRNHFYAHTKFKKKAEGLINIF